MTRLLALLLAIATLVPCAAAAQSPPVAGVTTGNPFNPGDTNNPHPTMLWWGPASPYGQFIRWVWMPPKALRTVDGTDLYEPGYWVSQTTAGYYYPARWVLQETTPGSYAWALINGGAVPYAR